MIHFKLQLGCFLICLYVAVLYLWERKVYRQTQREPLFDRLLALGLTSIFLDGTTAYTVNHLDRIPVAINDLLHLLFLLSLDSIIFLMFYYVLSITRGLPQRAAIRWLLWLPLTVSAGLVILGLPKLHYLHGNYTNYSMGIPAYTCYAMVGVYMCAALVLLLVYRHKISLHKRITITTFLVSSLLITGYQLFFPQVLLTSLVTTFAIVGSYLNMENPLISKLRMHQQEMVMGFSTLVENRDGSTGGHIRRTTEYVRMLAEELRRKGFYPEELTTDLIENLVLAAPLHDVGKISIPDAILQKPGKLTDAEYEIMKTHAQRGGAIIQELFSNTGGDDYHQIAYEVALHHHEKWNGTGYPDGLCRKDIPLCARIMAVADVFDAVSAKRCYRDALPLETCFAIIAEGSGRDFDPIIAETFLGMKDRICAYIASETDEN